MQGARAVVRAATDKSIPGGAACHPFAIPLSPLLRASLTLTTSVVYGLGSHLFWGFGVERTVESAYDERAAGALWDLSENLLHERGFQAPPLGSK